MTAPGLVGLDGGVDGPAAFCLIGFGDIPFLVAGIAAGIWAVNRPPEEQETKPHFHLPAIGSTTTRLWVSGAGMFALLVWLAVATLPDSRLHVAFLDVGQLRQY